jgi:hypothetical protein
MDKPVSRVNKIIVEEDKIYNATLTIKVKKMKIIPNSTGYEVGFEDVDTITEAITLSMKKNPEKFDNLMNESIAFNNDLTWQKETDYK